MGNLRRAWLGRTEAQPGPGQAAQDHTQRSAWDSSASGALHGPRAFRGHRAELTTPIPALLSVAGGGGVGTRRGAAPGLSQPRPLGGPEPWPQGAWWAQPQEPGAQAPRWAPSLSLQPVGRIKIDGCSLGRRRGRR